MLEAVLGVVVVVVVVLIQQGCGRESGMGLKCSLGRCLKRDCFLANMGRRRAGGGTGSEAGGGGGGVIPMQLWWWW